jgi:hypothetical protein
VVNSYGVGTCLDQLCCHRVTCLDPLAALVCLWRIECVAIWASSGARGLQTCRHVFESFDRPASSRGVCAYSIYVDGLLSMRSVYRHRDVCLYAGKDPMFLCGYYLVLYLY